MPKFFGIIITLSFFNLLIYGQNGHQRAISEDTLKSIIDQLRSYSQVTSKKQYELAFRGDSLAKISKDTFHIIEFKIEIGYLYYVDTKFNEAIKEYDKGLAIEKLSPNHKQLFELKRLKSIVYDRLGQFKSATDTLISALEVVISKNDTAKIISGYNSLGIFYKRAGYLENAEKYYLKNFDISSKWHDNLSYLIAANNLALFYKHLKETTKAYNLLDSVYRTTPIKNNYYKYGTIHNLGAILSADGQYQKAHAYLKEALNWARENNIQYKIAQNLFEIAIVNYQLRNYELALDQFNEVLALYTQLNDPERIMDTHYELSRVQEALKKPFEALANYKKYSILNDSLLSVKKTEEIAMNEAIFQNKIQGEQLAALQIKEELNEEKLFSRNLYIMGLSVVLASFIFISFIVYRKNKLIGYQKNEIEKINNALINSNEKITSQHDLLILRNKEVEAQNAEMENLMAIVAHDLKSPLNKIKGLSDILNYTTLNNDQNDILSKIQNITEEGRRLIEELSFLNNLEANKNSANPKGFDPVELIIEKISEYQPEALAKSIEINYAIESNISEFYSDRSYIGRIIDNLLSNAIKFSSLNSKIEVLLTGHTNLQLKISDHAQGFSEEDKKHLFQKFKRLSARPTHGESSTGLGLSIVKLLVDQLNGSIKVEDTPGGGATFIVNFPDFKKAEALNIKTI
ncbi:tetratricopeptide repeat-containing sensor histidine kinase [Mangrovivirga sp. M17]|uniref:histidine kinase n=1 Tax=Mangrovivirga halotolerans TaxID=2993936 RepID=A0ABT3RQD7_9BACT|nr:tetratricopeptide repeat-containing sensor histidine kinase [Mangrovivirga halotolerans]MCX2744005.1 tetratricopeptide repeat-containing sensor histidine kinase [Mangrovivirga halotolerans]